MIVEALIAIAPTLIGRSMPHRDEHPGGHRDPEQVVAGRPCEVLDQLPIGGARQLDCADDVTQVVADKDDAR
jgi:hypothetical protein